MKFIILTARTGNNLHPLSVNIKNINTIRDARNTVPTVNYNTAISVGPFTYYVMETLEEVSLKLGTGI